MIETYLEKITLSFRGGDFSVLMGFSPDTGIPADAALEAVEIPGTGDAGDYAAYLAGAEEALGHAAGAASYARFFALSVTDGQGRSLQPAEGTYASVRIGLEDAPAGELQVIRFPGDGEGLAAPQGAEVLDSQTEEDGEGRAALFQAGGFSVFGIACMESQQMEELYVSSTGEAYQVTVSYDPGAGIPEGAYLSVREIPENEAGYPEYIARTAAALDWEAEEISYALLLDISIMKDGTEIQPAEAVDVRIVLKDYEGALPGSTPAEAGSGEGEGGGNDAQDAGEGTEAEAESQGAAMPGEGSEADGGRDLSAITYGSLGTEALPQAGPEPATAEADAAAPAEIVHLGEKTERLDSSVSSEDGDYAIRFETGGFSVFAVAIRKASKAGVLDLQISTRPFYGGTWRDGIPAGEGEALKAGYVWEAASPDAGHRFNFHIEFTVQAAAGSGNPYFKENAVQVKVPKSIFKDRSGSSADRYEMSVPSEAELAEMIASGEELDQQLYFAYREEGDSITMYNFRVLEGTYKGYIEMSYLTTLQAFRYKDMEASAPFTATLSAEDPVGEAELETGASLSGERTECGSEPFDAYIDTQAALSSSVQTSAVLYDKWQSGWGTAPAGSEGYTYCVWEVKSLVDGNTQAYNLRFDSALSDLKGTDGAGNVAEGTTDSGGVKIIGYKLSGQNSYTLASVQDANVSKNQTVYGIRYDYILTAFDKSVWDTENASHWEASNNVTVTLIPLDGVDAESSSESKRTLTWNVPVFTPKTGVVGSAVRADGWYRKQALLGAWPRVFYPELGMQAGKYSRYDLAEFMDTKTLDSLDGLDYAVWMEAYPMKWTLRSGGEASAQEDYFQEPVKYVLTNEEFYAYDELKGSGEKVRLDGGDYRIDSLSFLFSCIDKAYNSSTAAFDGKADTRYLENETVHFYGKFASAEGSGSTDYIEIAAYGMQAKRLIPTEAGKEYISSSTNSKITFKEGAGCTAYKLETENRHYYTLLATVPKMSILRKEGGNISSVYTPGAENDPSATESIGIIDTAVAAVYDSAGNALAENKRESDEDYVRKVLKTSQLEKKVVATANVAKRRQYAITWQVSMREKMIRSNYEDAELIEQASGTFYDLLPIGSVLDPDSVMVVNQDGELRANHYTVTQTDNYKESGQTLMKVEIRESGDYYYLYYDTVHPFESINDYGRKAYNPIAYKTGNPSIADGGPDDGSFSQKEAGGMIRAQELMYGLEGTPIEESSRQFIFREQEEPIAAIISATFGLTKTVKSENSKNYSGEARVKNGGAYSYRIRFQNGYDSKAKDVVVYDSLEDAQASGSGRESDWHGTLQAVDFTALSSKLAPVVYISGKTLAEMQAENPSDGVTGYDLTKGWWIPVPEASWQHIAAFAEGKGISDGRASSIAIDFSKDKDDKDYVVQGAAGSGTLDALSVVLHMEAPARGERTGAGGQKENGYPEAYNQVLMGQTLLHDAGEGETLDLEDPRPLQSNDGHTVTRLFVSRDVNLWKRSPGRAGIRDVTFRLYGTSAYGEEVEKKAVSDRDGYLSFEDVEQGEYTLYEYEATPDWREDHRSRSVSITSEGEVLIDYDGEAERQKAAAALQKEGVAEGSEDYETRLAAALASAKAEHDYTERDYEVENLPRVHADVYLYKFEEGSRTPIPGTTFELSGTSDYEHDIKIVATSNTLGLAILRNVEKGSYTMKEINANGNYLLSDTQYKVTVSGTGSEDTEVLVQAPSEGGDGTFAELPYDGDKAKDKAVIYRIYNRPKYWNVRFLKVDADNHARRLQGAEFQLSSASPFQPMKKDENGNWAADGDPVTELKAVSNAGGVVSFEGLQAGTYLLRETKAPSGLDGSGKISSGGTLSYLADSSKEYVVEISEAGLVTIEGLQTIKAGSESYYMVENARAQDGRIVVYKKWKDVDTDPANRPVPKVHLIPGEDQYNIKRITVTKLWEGDYEAARPKDIKVVLEEIKGGDGDAAETKTYETAAGGWDKTGGSAWTYTFEVAVKKDASYYVYEDPDSVGRYYTSSAEGKDGKIPVQGGRATIINRFHGPEGEYDYTGKVQEYTAPATGKYRIEAWGAQGGDMDAKEPSYSSAKLGGRGGYTEAEVLLEKDQTIYISVGGAGGNIFSKWGQAGYTSTGGSGGWNGGGSGGNGIGSCVGSPGGGGASAVMLSLQEKGELKDYDEHRSDVLVVAGGGGGGGWQGKNHGDESGGYGGGTEGETVIRKINNYTKYIAVGGTQTDGYQFGLGDNGSNGIGGSSSAEGTGGGGGGWYGGWAYHPAAGVTSQDNSCVSGGGGSGHVNTDLVDIVLNGSTVAGNQEFTNPKTGAPETGHSGNGYVRITYLDAGSGEAGGSPQPAGTAAGSGTSASDTAATPQEEYVSEENGWTAVDGSTDTYMYVFHVFNDAAHYSYYEDAVSGYTSEVMRDAEHPEALGYFDGSAERSILITNTSTTSYGSLKVSKEVEGLTDSQQAFDFTLRLENEGKIKSGTQIIGGKVFNNGEITFSLKGGEEILFENLPVGTSYTVTEAKNENFEEVKEGEKKAGGTVSDAREYDVNFTNTYSPPARETDQDIRLSVFTSGTKLEEDGELSFTFHAAFKELEKGFEYVLLDNEEEEITRFVSREDGTANVSVTLGAGESAVFKKIPAGASFQITEDAGDFLPSYKITDTAREKDGHAIVQSTGQNTSKDYSLSTAEETVEAGEMNHVVFTNQLENAQTLRIRKEVAMGEGFSIDTGEAFRLHVSLSGLPENASIPTSHGKWSADDMGRVEDKEISLKHGEELVLRELPVGTEYVVTEEATLYTATYAFAGESGGQNAAAVFVSQSGGNAAAGRAMSTETEVVNRYENATLRISNTQTFLPLRIRNTVTGNAGEQDKEFAFTLRIPAAKGHTLRTGETQDGSLVFDASGDGSQAITLKAGESFTIWVPAGWEYSVTEADYSADHYDTSCQAGASGTMAPGNAVLGMQIDPDEEENLAAFTNSRHGLILEIRDAESGELLTGAGFKLNRQTGGAYEAYVDKISLGRSEAPLQSGTYQLLEEKAPGGYLILANSIGLEVRSDGTASLAEGTEGSLAKLVRPEEAGGKYTLIVWSRKGQSLPSTGGPGHWPYRAAGLLLLLLSFGLAWRHAGASGAFLRDAR